MSITHYIPDEKKVIPLSEKMYDVRCGNEEEGFYYLSEDFHKYLDEAVAGLNQDDQEALAEFAQHLIDFVGLSKMLRENKERWFGK
jgi:hypothetical protein